MLAMMVLATTDVGQPPSLIMAWALMAPNSASQAAPPSLTTVIIRRKVKAKAEWAHLLRLVSFHVVTDWTSLH